MNDRNCLLFVVRHRAKPHLEKVPVGPKSTNSKVGTTIFTTNVNTLTNFTYKQVTKTLLLE